VTGLVPYLVNGGMAAVIAAAFMAGLIYPRSIIEDKNQQIRELSSALALERQRSDAAVAAAAVTRDILLALRGGSNANMAETERQAYPGSSSPGGT